ncbi:hypothetical protein [Streptomyces sp. NPDC001889]
MAVDPTHPDTFDSDDSNDSNHPDSRDERETAAGGGRGGNAGHGPGQEAADGNGALGAEVPEADAVEQRREVNPQGDEPLTDIDRDAANEADALEQARVVGQDEDDYR